MCSRIPASPEPSTGSSDPFAREFGVGKLSAVTIGYEPHEWSSAEAAWKVPALADLVIYELMISEFGGDIDRTIAHLDYLADLGVNCIEVMPVSNVAATVDWGFLPIGYFGVDERFGKRRDLQRLIDAAHQRQIAVILDAVYGHTSDNFPYSYLYRQLGISEKPLHGVLCQGLFRRKHGLYARLHPEFLFHGSTTTGSTAITSMASGTTACPTTGTAPWVTGTPPWSFTPIAM